jgi:hypothetical protein
LIFPSTKPSPAGSSLDGGNRCVAENNFCQLIGHMTTSLQKHPVGVYEHQRAPARFASVQSFGLTDATA